MNAKKKSITYSNLARMMSCLGSVDLIRENTIPNTDRTNRDEGIKAHVVAFYLYNNTAIPDEIEQEMIDAAQIYVDDIKRIEQKTGTNAIIEGFLAATNYHTSLMGVPDAWLFDKNNNAIYVWDFKYGHSFVNEYQNWQLIGAAMGALSNCNHTADPVIILTVVQPRCYTGKGPVRSWTTSKNELIPYFSNVVSRINEYYEPFLIHECIVSPLCRNCPAGHVCDALLDAASYSIHLAYDNFPVELSGDTLGRELQSLESAELLLKARIDALKKDAAYRLENGERVRGYSLVSGMSPLQWSYDQDTLISMAALLGLDVVKTGVKTPTQVKNTKGVDPALVDSLAARVPTKPQLKQDGEHLLRIFK